MRFIIVTISRIDLLPLYLHFPLSYLFLVDPESSTQNAYPRPTTSEPILAWQLEKEYFGCAL